MIRSRSEVKIESFYQLRFGSMWRYFKSESLAFWMICTYLFLEYARPQSIVPALDFLPWTQLAVLGAFLGCFLDRTVRWVSSPVNLFLFLFLVLLLLSSVSAYWPSYSYRNLEDFYTWFVIYLLIINIVNTEKRFFIFICVFFITTFKISLSLAITWAQRGFSFTGWGLSGPPGFFQNSGELAIQMLVYWPLALGFAVHVMRHASKLKYFVVFLMPITGIMVIAGASSRGAQLALLIQLILINFRSIFKIKLIVLGAFLLFFVWSILPDEQKERFDLVGEDRSSIQRLLYWENGYEMLNQHPVLGVGYYNFIPYYDRYYPDDVLYEGAQLPHNIFIQVGSELGYPALFIYIMVILYVAIKTRSLERNLYQSGCDGFYSSLLRYLNVSLLGFVVAGQFVSVVYYPFLWVHLAFFVCIQKTCPTIANKNSVGRLHAKYRLHKA